MTEIFSLQVACYLFCVLLLIKPLGWYMVKVYESNANSVHRIGGPVEKWIYAIGGVKSSQGMDWKQYLSAMLLFNLLGVIVIYAIQRLQLFLPFNPEHLPSPSADLAFNTAVSFVTNTDWQSYSGETTMSYFTQMLGLTSQNFLSAATGMCLVIAFIRGLTQSESNTLGNFWVDLTRTLLYILLPLSLIFSVVLVSQGVIQNLQPNQMIHLVESLEKIHPNQPSHLETQRLSTQVIPMGPVASQVAIKQLGSNGGGFFNVNAAHPFENPNPVTNFLEIVALLLIPAALCYSFGKMVKDLRQGWAILIAMGALFVPFVVLIVYSEQTGNLMMSPLEVDQVARFDSFSGGNMEGKETRFGIVGSVLWTAATTASSNGSVNSMLDSYTPLAGLVPLWFMHLGEVVFGGVGSGLYGMLMLVIITVFVAGLMVGRTPEYLGKKIEPYEMKMACLSVLVMPLIVLVSSAIASVSSVGVKGIANPGAHGFTEILYAFTSMGNNNGSAFAGLDASNPFYHLLGGLVMLIGRFWIAIPVLAIAGSLVQKKIIPKSSGTLATHTPLFVAMLIGVAVVLGALSFLPSLALGPIVEQLTLWGNHGH